jgi:hypothetical protein
MVYPPATSEAGARRPAIIQLEQFKEASSKPAQLSAFSRVLTKCHSKKCFMIWYEDIHKTCTRTYAMLKAPVPSITVVKQHWAQSVLGWVTAYKRVNHTKDWLALLLARCCIASWGIDPDAPWRRDAWLYGTPRWVLAQTRQEACDRLETTVMRPSGTRENKQQTNMHKAKLLYINCEQYYNSYDP